MHVQINGNYSKRLLISVLAFLSWLSYGEMLPTTKMFTMLNGEVVATNDISAIPSQFDRQIGHQVDEFYEISIELLSELDIGLKKYLIKLVNPTRFEDVSYKVDDVLFNFGSYYLQVVPCSFESVRFIFINAYRQEDEAPSDDLVVVDGGGARYWTIIYSCEAKTFRQLYIHQDF